MYGKVEICGINTSKLPSLTDEEKNELIKRSREGDREAKDKLIISNLRLVLSVLQSFRNRTAKGANQDDLFQVGCIGLIKAVDNFDISQGVRFSTYAVPMIAGELRRFLRDSGTIRVSRSVKDTAYKALSVKEQIVKSTGKEPTESEIAKEMGISENEVVTALSAIMEPVSFYDPVYSENGDSLYVMDQISDKVNTDENWITNIALKEAVKKLNERERRILLLRFYNGKTQTEVSEEIGISQAQVSRLEKNAIEKIKNEL